MSKYLNIVGALIGAFCIGMDVMLGQYGWAVIMGMLTALNVYLLVDKLKS